MQYFRRTLPGEKDDIVLKITRTILEHKQRTHENAKSKQIC